MMTGVPLTKQTCFIKKTMNILYVEGGMVSLFYVFFIMGHALFGAIMGPYEALIAIMNAPQTTELSKEEAAQTDAVIAKPESMSPRQARTIIQTLGLTKHITTMNHRGAEWFFSKEFLGGFHWIDAQPYKKKHANIRRYHFKPIEEKYFVTTLKTTDPVIAKSVINLAAQNCYVVGPEFLDPDTTTAQNITQADLMPLLEELHADGPGVLIIKEKPLSTSDFAQKGLILKRVTFFANGRPRSALFIKKMDERDHKKVVRSVFSRSRMRVAQRIQSQDVKAAANEYHLNVAVPSYMSKSQARAIAETLNIKFHGLIEHDEALNDFEQESGRTGLIWIDQLPFPPNLIKKYEARYRLLGGSDDNVTTLVLPGKDTPLTEAEYKACVSQLPVAGINTSFASALYPWEKGQRLIMTYEDGYEKIRSGNASEGLVLVRRGTIPLGPLRRQGRVRIERFTVTDKDEYSVVVAMPADMYKQK